jgi:HK97 family phage prohead protease
MREIQTRAVALRANSYNPETRTFEATFSTGAARTLRDARGLYREVLDLSAVNPAELVGLPVFVDHAPTAAAAVGRVTAARMEGGALVGTIQLSAAPDAESIRVKVAEGTITGVSVGYTAERATPSSDASGRRVVTVSPRVREISLVGLPADPDATIRSESMEETTTEQPAPQPEPIRIRAHVAPTGSEIPAAQYALREEALTCRMMGTEPSAGARQFMAFGFADHAALSLRAAGEAGLGALSREGILHRAMHGTSDFANLLTGAGNRTLRAGYDVAASPLKSLAQHVTAGDFRNNDILDLGGFGTLSEVTEHGELTGTTTIESKTSWKLKTYGATFALTRRALINDDLGAFGRIPTELGKAAAETENAALAALLLSNPVMGDGVALFHASHGNLATTTGVPVPTTLSEARLAMRKQRGLTGELIAVTPKFLVVGPELETGAEQVLSAIQATMVEDVNVFAGKLQLLVEPRIADGKWYLFAAPSEAAVLLLGHLASAPGPQISSRDGWEVLGREFRVVLDFGVAATDHRGAFHNPGA